MMNLFLEEPDSNGVNFKEIGSIDDFWNVNSGPILNGLYWEMDDNASLPGFIYYENKLLGVPRLRQLRVRKGSCKVHSLFEKTIRDCYDSYSYFNEDQNPFGIHAEYNSSNGENPFRYSSSDIVKASIISGKFSTYGRGGYVRTLGSKYSGSKKIMENLKDNNWVDRGTRVVFLDFTVYNANINLFCLIRLITEFPATGGAIPTWTFRTVKLIRYVTPMDFFVLACEILFVLFVVYYTIEEIIEVCILI